VLVRLASWIRSACFLDAFAVKCSLLAHTRRGAADYIWQSL
jgi:hypothetical protein